MNSEGIQTEVTKINSLNASQVTTLPQIRRWNYRKFALETSNKHFYRNEILSCMLATDAHLPQPHTFKRWMCSPSHPPPSISMDHYNESWLTWNQVTASQKAVFPGSRERTKPLQKGIPSISLIYISELPSTGACHDWKHICAKCLLKPHKSLWSGINKLFKLQKFPYTRC